jgi:branched-chain amino acid transport system ATP-binding protein
MAAEPVEESGASALEITDLTVRYGRAVTALSSVSLYVGRGEVVTLMGLNGAGKSTLARSITGLLSHNGGSVMGGTVRSYGQDITRKSPRQIVRLGISQSFEGRRIFSGLTVQENLDVGAATRRRNAQLRQQLAWITELFPRLAERRAQLAGYLSGGEQQMLALGRALMQSPKLLVLDEPTLGLSPIFVTTVRDAVRAVREAGTSVLLIEQNAMMALSVSDRGYILTNGRITGSGTARELRADPTLKERLLGLNDNAEVAS